jgi:hypothetical protein
MGQYRKNGRTTPDSVESPTAGAKFWRVSPLFMLGLRVTAAAAFAAQQRFRKAVESAR